MPRWTIQNLRDYETKRMAGNKRSGACPVQKEFKDVDQGQTHHKPKESSLDRKMRPTYAIAINVLISDNRRRDIDNAATTLLDTLMLARQRLLSHCEKAGD